MFWQHNISSGSILASLWCFFAEVATLTLMLLGGNHHNHALAVEFGFDLYVVIALEFFYYLVKDDHTMFGSDDFSAAEEHGDLCLIAFGEEGDQLVDLSFEVVVGYPWSDFYLFDVDSFPVRVFLTQLIFVLTEVHDSAYRGVGCRGDLHEVKSSLHSGPYGISDVYDAKLFTLYVD